MRFSILKKFLIAFLTISLLPLFVLSIYASRKLVQVGHSAVDSSRKALSENAESLLEARARNIARQVELLLEGSQDDLRALSLLPFDADLYLAFSRGHQRRIWDRMRTADGDVVEFRKMLPLYREITYADPAGVEQIRIHENEDTRARRHVTIPFRGPFGEEDYFNLARALPPGDLYVSHLKGRHVTKEEQLQGAPDVESAVGGTAYEGIIRLARAVYREGVFAGVVSLALDHRHLMEFSQHVLPIGDHEVVFPSYSSGNYAFLFDDEGWIITHPKFWDIRGYDPETGYLIDPVSPAYNEAAMKAGKIPFNLIHVPFIHPNYRQIALSVLKGQSGVTTTASVGEVSRVLAYAPIRFNAGEYRKTGFFGGVTLGARRETFQAAVDETASIIEGTLDRTIRDFIFIILFTGIVVGTLALVLARSFSRPIQMLSDKVKEVATGHFDVSVDIRSGDELESLGRNFERMGGRLEQQRRRLVESMQELQTSRQTAVRERDFIRSVFANVASGLMVVNRDGRITAVNQNTASILSLSCRDMEEQQAETALADHPELLDRIRMTFDAGKTASVDLETVTPAGRQYLEVTLSPLHAPSPPDDHSVLVVIRDVTRRKRMEQHLRRSDRLVSLGTLAAGMAHEIRNPLTGISLMLDDLHDRMVGRQEDQVLMQRAMEEIEKLEGIVTELLEFAARPSENFERADLQTVIRNTIFLIKKQAKRQNVLLVEELDRDMPMLWMDPEKMKQALLNIMLNALNVMPGGGELHILAFTRPGLEMFSGGGGIELRICDTGPGVSPADMDYIFDPFFTRTPKGSGLGLSITHTIIEEHRGKIMVDSKLGRGACFKIFFPAGEEDSHAENTGS